MSAPQPAPSPPANASTSQPGLMSAADKTKLDGIPSGATATPLASTSPADVGTTAPGIAGAASRSDHVHAHGNQLGGALHANVVAAGAAGFITGADKTKLDGLPTSAVPTSRVMTAGAGMTGTGDLSADRTFDVVANADGSITVNANDIQVGVLATDGQHGVRGGGTQHAAATQSVNGFMSAADKVQSDLLPSLVATWSLTLVRHFLVDLTNGDDLRVGYIDAAPNADLSASAPALAIKTMAKLKTLIPQVGHGRKFEVIILGRPDAVENAEDTNFTLIGYRRPTFRGTATNTTAGCVAWDGSTADHVFAGGRQVPGTNAAGYQVAFTSKVITAATAGSPLAATIVAHGYTTGDWVEISGALGIPELNGRQKITVTSVDTFTLDGTIGTGTWTSGGTVKRWKVLTAAGGAPGWTDEGTALANIGLTAKRIRFDAACPTTALRNFVANIDTNGIDTFIPMVDPAGTWTTATASDFFYIEEPNVRLRKVGFTMRMGVNESVTATAATNVEFLQIVGIRGLFPAVMSDAVKYTFCEATAGFSCNDVVNLSFLNTYVDLATTNSDAGTTVTAGGCRLEGQPFHQRVGNFQATDMSVLPVVLAPLFLRLCPFFGVNRGVFRGGISLAGCGAAGGPGVNLGINQIGPSSASTNRTTRLVGVQTGANGVVVVGGSTVLITNAEITDAGALACVVIRSSGSQTCLGGGNFGTRGNNYVGVAFRPASFSGGTDHSFVNNILTVSMLVTGAPSNGMRGTLGAYATACRGIPGQLALFQHDEFRSLALARVPDVFGNVINIFTGSNANILIGTVEGVGDALNGDGATAAPYRVVRASTPSSGVDAAQLAQADTVAHCTGILGCTINNVAASGIGAMYLYANKGLMAVKFDRTGAHPAPTALGLAYVSTDTAGLAQADSPPAGGGRQKMRLGVIRRIHPVDTDTAFIDLRPDPVPVAADGAL